MYKMNFFHGVMGSGKTSALIGTANLCKTQGKRFIIFTYAKDAMLLDKFVSSRDGRSFPCSVFEENTVFLDLLIRIIDDFHSKDKVLYLFIDEAQFLTSVQVEELAHIVDKEDILIFAYGLKTDFRGFLFDGTKRFLELAENVKEIEAFCCHCDQKATHNIRLKIDSTPIFEGETIVIGKQSYIAVCRCCYFKMKENYFCKKQSPAY